MSVSKIRIMLVDDHPLVAEGITARLENEACFDVVAVCNDGAHALQRVEDVDPDVILMDISMPVMNGFEATAKLKAEWPDVKVLILSMHDNKEYILKLIQCGAAGYVLKDVCAEELTTAIRTVHGGATYFSSGASRSLFDQAFISGERIESADDVLSTREVEVLKILAQGGTNKEVARILDISVRTAEAHRQNIRSKLNIQTSAGLVKYAIEQKLID